MDIHTKSLTCARLGCILRAARKFHGFTLQEVADLLKVKLSRLHHWESGRSEPPLPQLQVLCYVLRLDPAFLFTGKGKGLDTTLTFASARAAGADIEINLYKRQEKPTDAARYDVFCIEVGLPTVAQLEVARLQALPRK